MHNQYSRVRPSNLRYSWEVLRAFTIAELRETREFTFAGILKWALEPLSYMIVYFILVAAVLNRSQRAFPLFLLCALVPWRFFTGATSEAMHLMVRYREIVRNRIFPRILLPLMLIAAEGASLLVALIIFVPMLLYYQVNPGAALLWLPILLFVLAVLTAGPAYLATLFGLYFPDYRGAAQNLIRMGYFLSSGLVALENVPGDNLPRLLAANPFSGLFDSFRAVLLHAESPRPWDIAYPFLIGTCLFGLGIWMFQRRVDELPKEV